VRITVRKKKSWFRTTELENPNKTVYSTTSESMLVIEPDGTATCIGTQGKPSETAWIGAANGNHHGHLAFDLQSVGPGPSLAATSHAESKKRDERYEK